MSPRRKKGEETATTGKRSTISNTSPEKEKKVRHGLYIKKSVDEILTDQAQQLEYRSAPQFFAAILAGLADLITTGEIKKGNPLLMFVPPPVIIQQALPGMMALPSPVQEEENLESTTTYDSVGSRLLDTEEPEE